MHDNFHLIFISPVDLCDGELFVFFYLRAIFNVSTILITVDLAMTRCTSEARPKQLIDAVSINNIIIAVSPDDDQAAIIEKLSPQ